MAFLQKSKQVDSKMLYNIYVVFYYFNRGEGKNGNQRKTIQEKTTWYDVFFAGDLQEKQM